MNATPCTCPPGRALGDDHVEPCSLAGTTRVVPIYRNPETGRPVAVPEEIVSEAEREYRAYLLHQRGKTWHEIAMAESYLDAQNNPSGSIAAAAVQRYLDEGRAVVANFTRAEVLATEVAVLRAMREAMWDGATVSKKPTHVMAVLATHDRMVKVFRLDQADEDDMTVQTVVVPSEDFIASLRAVVPLTVVPPAADAG